MHEMIRKGEGVEPGSVTYGIQIHPEGERNYVSADTARRLLRDLASALSCMVVPVQVMAKPTKVRWSDLQPGMVCEMRRGGIRRIERIEEDRVSAQWAHVFWIRVDDGPHKGKTGRQTANYFARDVLRVLASAPAERPNLDKLTNRQRQVLDALDNVYRTSDDIAKRANIRTTWPAETAERHLGDLLKLGLVERFQEAYGGQRTWRLLSPSTETE